MKEMIDHGAKLAQHDAAIDSLTKSQDKLSTDIHNLDNKLDNVGSRIFGKLDAIVHSSRPDVKGVLMGLIATVAVMLTSIGLFVKLTVDPIKEGVSVNAAYAHKINDKLTEQKEKSAYDRGKTEALLESIRRDIGDRNN